MLWPMTERRRGHVVVGPYRSGTSLVTRIMCALGASPGPADELYEPTDWNPSGYFQRPDVTAFNTALIRRAGGDLTTPPRPDAITEACDRSTFDGLDLGWIGRERRWVIKDPRFSFTLSAWIAQGMFDGSGLSLIRLTRDLEPCVASCLVHYDVRHYCENSVEVARAVVGRYDEAARWHGEHLGPDVPSLTVSYEQLVARPVAEVRRIADFVEVDDPRRIADAVAAMSHGASTVIPQRPLATDPS